MKILELKVKRKVISNPVEVATIFYHFIESIHAITRCFLSEPDFSIRPVSDSDVMRTNKSLTPSRAKDKYGCCDAQRVKFDTNQTYH